MKKLKLGVLGIDHGHIYDMLGEMLNLGCTCDYWWTKEETNNNKSFQDKFPFLSKVEDKMKIIEEDETDIELLKISTELMELTLKWIDKGSSPLAIAGCLMATASRMYQEQLTEEEWIALMDSVIETTTNPNKQPSKETFH